MEGTGKEKTERDYKLYFHLHILCQKGFIICVQEIGFTLRVFYENIFTVKKTLRCTCPLEESLPWKKYLPL